MGADAADAANRAATQSVEAILASERAQFQLAERAGRFGYWRLTLADSRATWSPGMYRLLGLDPDFPADNDWLLEQLIEEDAVMVRATVAEAIRARSPFRYCTRSKFPDAVAQVVETQGEVEVGADGRVVAIIGVCHDITEKVRAEEARAKAEQIYYLMTEEASDIIILYGAGGKILFTSEALWRTLKRTVAEIDGSAYMKIIHPDDRGAAAPLAIWPEDGKITVATYRVKHGDGQYVWIETTTRAIYDENGNFRNGISVARDVSERKTQQIEMQTARENAEAANKAKSGFLANMSHELRTPLNAIIGFSDIMHEELFGKLGNERYEEYVTLIRESGELLLDLITDILDMAKIEAGKLELHVERVDLAGTIEDCAHLLNERAAESGIKIALNLPSSMPQFFADRRAVKQILINLLSNAIKFSMPGGQVRVETQAEGDRVILRISDDGVGIPADQLPRLGRPFEQVCLDPMLAKGGTGLGLALVRALAEKHGGSMTIESEEGVGTKVIIELPLQAKVSIAA